MPGDTPVNAVSVAPATGVPLKGERGLAARWRWVAPSFRLRLLLAMVAVVVSGTAATLIVAQQKLATAHRQLTEQRFRHEQDLWRVAQEARLRGAQSKCHTFARSIRLQALMRRWNESASSADTADLEATAEKLYQTAGNELREVIQGESLTAEALSAALFRFLAVDGRTVPPPSDLVIGQLPAEDAIRLDQLLGAAAQAASGRPDSQVGHLALQTIDGAGQLIEVILQPIVDAKEGDGLGALVVGFKANPSASRQPHTPKALDDAEMRDGIWLDGILHSKTLTASERSSLGRLVGAARPKPGNIFGDLVANLNKMPHRVFFAELNPGSPFPRAFQVSAFPLDGMLRERGRLMAGVIGFGVIVLAGATALSGFLAHGLSVPIRQLVAATGEIGRGNYCVRVDMTRRDELGRLAVSFNEMADGLLLKEKYRSVLNLVADKEIAEALMSRQVALGGERRQVSILFCDIRGFTALTQDMAPEEVVQMLNEHFTPLTQVVYEHHGVVDKYVGDLIMGVFGAPRSHGCDAANAALCALRMVEARRQLNERSRYQIEMGIGVASGYALAGCMGSTDRMSYTVLGERVNLASRLCGKAGRMEVWIDLRTREQLDQAALVEALPPISLKGFSAPVRGFRLLAMQVPPAEHDAGYLPSVPTSNLLKARVL